MKTRKTLLLLISILALALLCPRHVAAWRLETHVAAADAIKPYMPAVFKDAIKQYPDEFRMGLETEDEIFDRIVEEHDKYQYGAFTTAGMERLIYHVERLQFLVQKKTQRDVLAFTLGQFIHCAGDLFEPLPDTKKLGALQIAGNRLYVIDDFQKNNAPFDFLYDGRSLITNYPEAVQSILEKNKADGEAIYTTYSKERTYTKIDHEATAGFNRGLNFMLDALVTMEQMSRTSNGRFLDIRGFLGIDQLRKYNDREQQSTGIEKPTAPDKPTAPAAPK